MSRTEWSPGPHHVFVHGDVLLLLAGDLAHGEVLEVWDRLVGTEVTGLGTVLEILGDVTGAALSSLPDFAMAVLDDKGLHVAARGAGNVIVSHVDGSEVDLCGGEVSTWLERNVDAASVAHVLLAAGTPDVGWLPLEGGVVPAGGVRVVLAEDAALPEPAVTPVVVDPVDEPEHVEASVVEVSVVAPVGAPAPRSVETLVEVDADPEAEDDVAVEVDSEVEPEDSPTPGRFSSLLSPYTVLHDVEEAALRPREVEPEATEPPEPVRVEDVPAAATPVSSGPSAAGPPPPPAPSSSSGFISGIPGMVVQSTPVDDSGEHHDGHTMLEAPDSTELDAYLADPAAGEEMVLGVRCSAGHGNPVHRSSCRVCGVPLSGGGERMPRPSLGTLITSAGETIDLERNVLAGRNPQASRITGPVLPRLLPLPHSHVSGTHLEIRLESWSVMVVDLDSTNGTFLQRPGQPTVRISRSPQLLMAGDVVQLGHGVDLRFEDLP